MIRDIFFGLSVSLSDVNFYIRYNLWTIRDRDFIWHAYSTNEALSNDFDIHAEKIPFWDFVAGRGHSVSQT